MSAFEILMEWKRCVELEIPHASLRVGDAESVVLAHETILTMEFVEKMFSWIRDPAYTGVILPNSEVREALVEAYRSADAIGHLVEADWPFKPLDDMCMQFYGITTRQSFYTYDNRFLVKTPWFYDTFKNTEVILVGGKAAMYKEVLERRYRWKKIVEIIVCHTWDDLESAKLQMNEMAPFFKLALICAGSSAKVLSVHAKKLGRVGVDFGGGLDTCLRADGHGYYGWEYDGL